MTHAGHNVAAVQQRAFTVSKQDKNSPRNTRHSKANENGVQTKFLFFKVNTTDSTGASLGDRIVDIYHYGTHNWMQDHMWWAVHKGHVVTVTTATEAEVKAHTDAQIAALAAKFAKPAQVAA